jgi:HSP20 family protein
MAEWNPFADIDALRQEVDRAFEGFGVGQTPNRRVAFLPGRDARRYPLINLREDRDNFYVEALTPGVDPESVIVTVTQNRLTLSGEKGGVGNINLEAFHRNERASGKFGRTVDLPADVDDAKIQAQYKNGLLFVTLPKGEKAKPKQISVTVA